MQTTENLLLLIAILLGVIAVLLGIITWNTADAATRFYLRKTTGVAVVVCFILGGLTVLGSMAQGW